MNYKNLQYQMAEDYARIRHAIADTLRTFVRGKYENFLLDIFANEGALAALKHDKNTTAARLESRVDELFDGPGLTPTEHCIVDSLERSAMYRNEAIRRQASYSHSSDMRLGHAIYVATVRINPQLASENFRRSNAQSNTIYNKTASQIAPAVLPEEIQRKKDTYAARIASRRKIRRDALFRRY